MLLRTHTIRRLGRGLGPHQCTRFHRQWLLSFILSIQTPTPSSRAFHATPHTFNSSFTNLLADADNPPPVQVSSISDQEGIRLVDGLVLPAACIFLEGRVYLWDVPLLKPSEVQWQGWTKDHFELFDIVVPKPGTPRFFCPTCPDP
jgi:NADH dehydrogenase [ubiquinone] 1 alpha subcomplex assembly factor 3